MNEIPSAKWISDSSDESDKLDEKFPFMVADEQRAEATARAIGLRLGLLVDSPTRKSLVALYYACQR